MKLNAVNQNLLLGNYPLQENGNTDKNNSFINYLKDALSEVDALQKEASFSASKLVLGEEEFLHNTMLAYEKANLAFTTYN